MNYTPTCPYNFEVEVQAWGEGLTAGLHNNQPTNERNELNPYTSGDTCVAWAQGYDDGKYSPAPFNPADIEELSTGVRNYISVSYMHDLSKEYPSVVAGQYLLYSWTGGTLHPEDRPAWITNRPEHRRVKINQYDLTRIVRQGMNDRQVVAEGGIELPCPPYEFTYSEGGMRITAGSFTKWGSKDEWDGVLTEMREKWEEIPAGLDVNNVSINVYVTAPATAQWTTSVEVTDMVEHHNGIYTGTEDELHDEVEAYMENLEGHEVDHSWAEVEYEIDDYSVEAEASDLTYDLQEVSEV